MELWLTFWEWVVKQDQITISNPELMAQRAKEKGIEIKNPNVIENKNQIKKKKIEVKLNMDTK